MNEWSDFTSGYYVANIDGFVDIIEIISKDQIHRIGDQYNIAGEDNIEILSNVFQISDLLANFPRDSRNSTPCGIIVETDDGHGILGQAYHKFH